MRHMSGRVIKGTIVAMQVEQEREAKSESWNFPDRHGGIRKYDCEEDTKKVEGDAGDRTTK